MELSILTALVAAVTAGIAMSLVRSVIRASGVPLRMDVARMWLTLLGVRGGAAPWAGLFVHLVVSVLIGVAYAIGFQVLAATDRLVLWGLLGAMVHYAVAGLALTALPPVHPEVPERSPAPGAFARALGRTDMLAFLAGHLVFGVVFGLVYGATHPAGGWTVAF